MSKNKTKLLSYLKSQHTMSLATFDGKLWICTVFYAIDDKLNFYFISEPNTRHSKGILKNSQVACSIANTNQVTTDKKIGVQIVGIASEVKNRNKIKVVLGLWNKVNPGFESIINLPNMIKKVISGKVYLIKPKEIKFFNEKLYGSEGFEIFKF